MISEYTKFCAEETDSMICLLVGELHDYHWNPEWKQSVKKGSLLYYVRKNFIKQASILQTTFSFRDLEYCIMTEAHNRFGKMVSLLFADSPNIYLKHNF